MRGTTCGVLLVLLAIGCARNGGESVQEKSQLGPKITLTGAQLRALVAAHLAFSQLGPDMISERSRDLRRYEISVVDDAEGHHVQFTPKQFGEGFGIEYVVSFQTFEIKRRILR